MRLATLFRRITPWLAAPIAFGLFCSALSAQSATPDIVLQGKVAPVVEPTLPYTFQTFDFPPEPPRENVEAYERQEALASIGWANHKLPDTGGQPLGPTAGTETSINPAPGDLVFKLIGTLSPTTGSSSINEPSIGVGGGRLLMTGNWWAAKHFRGGKDDTIWQYIDPYADFPMFCCDQDVVLDPHRNIFIWYRQGIRDASGENEVKITCAFRYLKTFWTYTVTPSFFGFTGDWFDYPHLGLTNNYLYITTNMFLGSTNFLEKVYPFMIRHFDLQ